MYKLLRRISSSFTGRRDRTCDDDAIPNGIQSSRKRRMSDDNNDETSGSLSKRSRAHEAISAVENDSETVTPHRESSPSSLGASPGLQKKETEEVRQVTKGVKDVELEDKDPKEPVDANKDEPPAEVVDETSKITTNEREPELEAEASAKDGLNLSSESLSSGEEKASGIAKPVDNVASVGPEEEPPQIIPTLEKVAPPDHPVTGETESSATSNPSIDDRDAESTSDTETINLAPKAVNETSTDAQE